MNNYIKEHESFILNLLSSSEDVDWIRMEEYHKTKIEFLQQERLAHLLVTLAFAFLLIASSVLLWFHPVLVVLLLDFILSVLVLFYAIHYYHLENGVQRWYRLYDSIFAKINQ